MTMKSHASSPTGSESRLARVLDDYLAALERGETLDRAALRAAHPDLAEDLEACLASLDFIRRAAASGSARIVGDAPLEIEPIAGRLGDFRIIREAGRGGMGVVYEAEQISLGRRVALKILPFAAALDPRQLQRFKVEAQAAAQLHHTNIVPVFSVGVERGVHYYAMQFIEGRSLAEVIGELRGNRDSADARPSAEISPGAGTSGRSYFEAVAKLGVQVADALEHAHSKGVIHRDVKPSNLIVDWKGEVWVTDFGLARLRGDSELTRTGDLIGTLRYMSPERALGRRTVIDEKSDVYSVGVTLYELLALRPPFETDDRAELLVKIANEEPVPLRRLNPALPYDLETIVAKAMGKEPEARYAAAGELADDLRRFLDARSVHARRPSLFDRTRKWARRHRTVVASSLLLSLLAIVGSITAVTLIGRERAQVAGQQARARLHRYASDMRQAHQLILGNRASSAQELLLRWRPVGGEEDARNFAWHYLWKRCHDERRTLSGHKGAVYHTEFSADGRILVSCGQDGTVRFWDVTTGRLLRTIDTSAGEVNWAAFTQDGRTLATVHDDGVLLLWAGTDWGERTALTTHKGDVIFAAFVAEGRRVVTAGRTDGFIRIWDVESRREIKSQRVSDDYLEGVAVSPDGQSLAIAANGRRVNLWKLDDLSKLSSSLIDDYGFYGVAFSSDGSRLAVGSSHHVVELWEPGVGERRVMGPGDGHRSAVQSVALLPGDHTIVSASDDMTVKLWDVESGRCMGTLQGHTGKVWGVSISPDGATLATASSDGTVKLWAARIPDYTLSLPPETVHKGLSIAFTTDGKALGAAQTPARTTVGGRYLDSSLEIWGFETETRDEVFHNEFGRHVDTRGPVLTADCRFVAFLNTDGSEFWDVAAGKRLSKIEGDLRSIDQISSRFVAAQPEKEPIRQIDVVTGRVVRVLDGTESLSLLSCSPSGRFITALDDRYNVILLDVTTGRRELAIRASMWRDYGPSVFSREETMFATTDPGHLEILLWDSANRESVSRLLGHNDQIVSMAFSPDGKVLASGGRGGQLILWDIASREMLAALQFPVEFCQAVRFSPDSRTLAFLGNHTKTGIAKLYLLTTTALDDATHRP
jgi:WD40 repeat protein/serine/threonine protein kinase